MADALEDGRVYLPKPNDRRRSSARTSESGASTTDGRLCCASCVALMHAFNGPLVLMWKALFAACAVSVVANFFSACVLLSTPGFALLVQRNSFGGAGVEVAVVLFGWIIIGIFVPMLATMNRDAPAQGSFDELVTSDPRRIVPAWIVFIVCTALLITRMYAFFAVVSAIAAILTPVTILVATVQHFRRLSSSPCDEIVKPATRG